MLFSEAFFKRYSVGVQVNMSPQDFLKLAMPFGVGGGPEVNQDKLKFLQTLDTYETNPMLSIKQLEDGSFQVGLHDGRHRALVAIKNNESVIAVDIVRGKKYAREHPAVTDMELVNMVRQAGSLLSEDGSTQVTVNWN
jgi:phage-related protein